MTTDEISKLLEKYTTNNVVIKGIPGDTLTPSFDGWYFEFLMQEPEIKRRAAKVNTRALNSLETFIVRELTELNKV